MGRCVRQTMTKKSTMILSACALSLLLLQALPGEAAVTAWQAPRAVVWSAGDTVEDTALKFLAGNADLLEAGSVEDLRWVKTSRIGDVSYVRFRQTFRGMDVENADVVVTLHDKGLVYQVTDTTVAADAFPASDQCISRADAENLVLSMKPDLVVDGSRGPVYIATTSLLPEAWYTVPVVVGRNGDMRTWEVYVDCSNGSVVAVRSLFWEADANVFDPNPAVDTDGPHRITLQHLTSSTNLEGSFARAYSCVSDCLSRRNRVFTQYAVADLDGNFLYEPDEPSTTDPFSETSAYYHLDKITTWFEEELGFVYECGSPPQRLPVDVYTNMDETNGYFMAVWRDTTERCADIVLGGALTPPGRDFAYDGEVIYHEYTHGVIIDTMGWSASIDVDQLGHDYSPDGISEGTADYYALTVTDNPVLGEYALTALGGTRRADNDRVCPDGIVGEGHYDGQLWSGTLWDIRTQIGAAKTDRLALSVLNTLPGAPSFHDAGTTLVNQARALEGSVLDAGDADIVEAAVNTRQLIGCERVVYLEDGESAPCFADGTYYYSWGGSEVDFMTCGVQFAVEAPAGARRVILRLTGMTASGYAPDYDVYINYNMPVGYNRVGDIGAVANDYEYVVAGSPTSLAWTEFSDPLIVPGTTYHVSVVSRDPYGLWMTAEASVVVGPVAEPTDDASDAVEDELEDDVSPADTVEDAAGADAAQDAQPDAQEDAAQDDTEDDGEDGGEGGCGCQTVV
jgi:hypothetical protein